ncbi:MAG: HD domain-containing protein [Candidatus Hodarchaeota archaeon]
MVLVPDYATCIKLLIHHSTPFNVINHVIFTTQTALKISKRLKKHNFSINCDIVLAGAMLHDLGRSKTHQLTHGIIGAQMLRQNGFSDELARIAEIHLFAGILAEEAREFGLPSKDYVPLTLEEKIITYADNISKKNSLLTTREVITRFSKYFDSSHPILIRVYELHNEIEDLLASN